MNAELVSTLLSAEQLDAIVNKLGGLHGALRFLGGELSVSEPACSWREEDGVIYFKVTSDGTTGEDWIKRLEQRGCYVSEDAKRMLCSSDFVPTCGVSTEVAVLKCTLFSEKDRTSKKVRAEAGRRKLLTPNAEVACLIRLKFTDEEIETMGLSCIATMHSPINSSLGMPCLLLTTREDSGNGEGYWIATWCEEASITWCYYDGFAFAVSQVSL